MRLTQPGLIACFAMVTVGLSSCGGETDVDFPETGGGGGGGRPTGALSGGSGGARAGAGGVAARGGSLGSAGSDLGGSSQVENGGMAGAPAQPPPPVGGAAEPGVGGSGGAKAEPPAEAGAPAKAGEGGAPAKGEPPEAAGAGGKADPPPMGGEGGKADPPPPAEGGAGGGEDAVICPDEQPEPGSACEGKGACDYEAELCRCEPKGTWACMEAPE